MTMTTTPGIFQQTVDQFLSDLSGKNRSSLTIRCYSIDVSQFLSWIAENDLTVGTPAAITKSHLSEYLTSLSDQGLSGQTRARKLAAIKEYFRFLVGQGILPVSPAESVTAPKRERNGRNYLTPEEYTRLLSLSGSNPRDYAILQVFLQTGIRISELCSLTLSDVDLADRSLTIRQGKGMADRSIELEKKGLQALRNYLQSRQQSLSDSLFLNYQGEPISERGVQKLLAKYVKMAGITKKISPHSLRHTFATHKAERGVPPYQLQQWLGHRNLNTTQIYQYQTLANRLPQGGILIVLPIEGQKQRVFEETAAQLKRNGRRVTTVSVTRFIP
jgi:integrase/recombinase XerC